MRQAKNAEKFWMAADHFRGAGQLWAPSNAGYELRRSVDVEGKSWTVCFKIHVVADERTGRGGVSFLFKSSVTLWPPKLSNQDEKRLIKTGWYKANEQILTRAGYHGKWSNSPHGTWGDFWKNLRGVEGVRQEAKRLEGFQLAPPSGSPK